MVTTGTQTGMRIGRIDPVAPVPSLLTSARPLGGPGGTPYEVWRTGVSWAPFPCQPSYAWPRCVVKDGGEWPTKTPPVDNAGPTSVDTFMQYVPISCSPVFSDEEMDDIRDDARSLLDAQAAYRLARALWMGDGLPATNPTLRNTAV